MEFEQELDARVARMDGAATAAARPTKRRRVSMGSLPWNVIARLSQAR